MKPKLLSPEQIPVFSRLLNFLPAVALFFLMAGVSPGLTNTNWTGDGDGQSWNDVDNWSGGIPNAATDLRASFLTGTGSPTQLLINVPNGASSDALRFEGDVNVRFVIDDGDSADFAGSTFWRFGDTAGGPSLVTLDGGGTISAQQITMGLGSSAPGNTLTLLNGTTLTEESGTATALGRFANGNRIEILSGSEMTRYALWIAQDAASTNPGTADNQVVVSGEDSLLRVIRTAGGSANVGLRIGATGTTSATGYSNGLRNNSLLIQDGGRVEVSADAGVQRIFIGEQAHARSNYILIEGTGSTLEMGTASDVLEIGNSDGTNLGGNYVEVRNGGSLISSGAVRVRDYDRSASQTDGANLLIVGSGGTVDFDSSLISTGGTVRLEDGGAISASIVQIGSTGRFEVGGGSLTTPEIRLQDADSAFAIGLPGDTAPSAFTLGNTFVDLRAATVFETSIFGANPADVGQLNFGAGSSMDISVSAIFRLNLVSYNPSAGDEWIVFTGLTSGIDGDFDPLLADLPGLSGNLEWDLSGFNEAGGWVVAVIPEPGSALLLLIGFWILGCRRHRSA